MGQQYPNYGCWKGAGVIGGVTREGGSPYPQRAALWRGESPWLLVVSTRHWSLLNNRAFTHYTGGERIHTLYLVHTHTHTHLLVSIGACQVQWSVAMVISSVDFLHLSE